jgi:hypothetical protein
MKLFICLIGVMLMNLANVHGQPVPKLRFGYDASGHRITRNMEYPIGYIVAENKTGDKEKKDTAALMQETIQKDSAVNTIIEEKPSSILKKDYAGLLLYPNPVESEFKVTCLDDRLTGSTLVVYEVSGKMVHKQKVSSSIALCDISHLSTAIYIVEIIDNSQRKYQYRIVKL